MLDGPDASSNGYLGDENERSEDCYPAVPLVLQIVGRKDFKHQQEQVKAGCYEQGTELDVGLDVMSRRSKIYIINQR